jgi:hypoxanthine-DNA glycosylase
MISEIFSFEPIVDHETEVLIIGTMPGEESLRLGIYYGNEKNHFWEFMYHILNNDGSPVRLIDRNMPKSNHYQFLLKYKIGLWDAIKSCQREGSNDSKIKNEKYNDLSTILTAKTKLIICSPKSFYYLKKSGQVHSLTVPIKVLGSTSSMNSNNTFKVLNEWKDALAEWTRVINN